MADLKERVHQDGYVLEEELCFLDDGYSGETLWRPALDRLRDVAYAGALDRLYVHCPDRLAREYAYQVLKHRKVSIVALDYAFGWECSAGFHRTFEEAGGKVLQKIWIPLTVTDFSPYLAQISKYADAVYGVFLARSSLQFTKQYQEFGMKLRLLCSEEGRLRTNT